MSKKELSITYDKQSSTLTIDGPIDEQCGPILLPFIEEIKGPCTINLSKVDSINSLGAMAWVRFLTLLLHKTQVTFVECSVDFVAQTNMIVSFQGSAAIESAYGQFFCNNCYHDEVKLYRLNELVANLTTIDKLQEETHVCSKCGDSMTLGDDSLIFLTRMIQTSKKIKKVS